MLNKKWGGRELISDKTLARIGWFGAGFSVASLLWGLLDALTAVYGG